MSLAPSRYSDGTTKLTTQKEVEFFMLRGYKTYIIGALVFIVGGLMAIHIIPRDLGELIIIFLGGLGGISLRAAIAKGPNNPQ